MDDDPHPEFERLAKALGGLSPRPDVPLTVGDDGAHILPPSRGLITVADMMVEGIHFRSSYTPPRALGHKILAVNLSDIAAMGGTPRYALFTLGVPPSVKDDVILDVFQGLRCLGDRHGLALVGGDLTAAPEGAMVASLTCIGSPGSQGPITRRGAQIGDDIGLIGTLGGASRALERLEAGEAPGAGFAAQGPTAHWTQPLFFPEAKVEAGERLGGLGINALIDISDGLVSDLGHLLNRGVLGGQPALGAKLNLDALPLHPNLTALPRDTALAHALYGGEDYALLLTAPPSTMASLINTLGVHIIGTITEEIGLRFGDAAPPKGTPWAHFKGDPNG